MNSRQSNSNYKKFALMLIGVAIVLGALTFMYINKTRDNRILTKIHPSLIDNDTLVQLAKTETPIDQSHLDAEVAPPTNKWFSGFALQAQPKPGYNYPNSFLPLVDGFEFSLPRVTTENTLIKGGHSSDIVVSIDGATNYKITNYDELTVELTYYSEEEQPLAKVRVASGLPYVYLSSMQDINVRFNGTTFDVGGSTHIKSNDNHYGVNVTSNGNSFSLSKGADATFFSAPTEAGFDTVSAQSGAVVTSGEVSYERNKDSFKTTFTYLTTNGEPTLFARLPHQNTDIDSAVVYRSILGEMETEVGTEFSFDTSAVPVSDKLDLTAITREERELIVRQLEIDVEKFENKPDTYFGGKQLYRMAQLMTIAEQLNEEEAASIARSTMKRELELWLTVGKSDPKSFLYDPAMSGIVGNEASFGSDKEFNDHHFHYGYFIYAAAILAQYDSTFLENHKDMINLIVADIANYNSDEKLPLRRSFDPYAGHSWASGTAPFLDGNNQESTSEAVNAWVGVSLWADQINNEALKLEADWMLSLEYRTAQVYWLLQGDESAEYLAPYSRPIASLVWGGKREYATFFSNEPNAKLAIQLLPLSPTMKLVDNNLPDGVFEGTSIEKQYGDHILMAKSNATLEQAINLPDIAIDDGNSRTYLYAYILAK